MIHQFILCLLFHSVIIFLIIWNFRKASRQEIIFKKVTTFFNVVDMFQMILHPSSVQFTEHAQNIKKENYLEL